MCNLNLLFRKKNLSNKKLFKIAGFLQTVTTFSYSGNSDGDGVFFSSGLLAKSTDKLNYLTYLENIRESQTILTHQRYATSGVPEKDIHPFQFGDFVCAHNGVVSEYDKGGRCDSYHMFKDFYKNFEGMNKKNKHEHTREQLIVSAVRSVFNNVRNGSYSIVIHDTSTGDSYYFKNSQRMIYFLQSANYYYLTTKFDNKKYLYMLDDGSFEETDLENMTIYRIRTRQNKLSIDNIGIISLKVQLPATRDCYQGYDCNAGVAKKVEGVDDYYWDMTTESWIHRKTGKPYLTQDWEDLEEYEQSDEEDDTVVDGKLMDVENETIVYEYEDTLNTYVDKQPYYEKCSICKIYTPYLNTQTHKRICTECMLDASAEKWER